MALTDSRELAPSVLADEAGVALSTLSEHLSKLLDGGLVAVRAQGRRRYYRLADDRVAQLIEMLASMASIAPVRSLREGSRAHALRQARTCYDHLAGRLGVALFADMLAMDWVRGGDGHHHPETAVADRFSAPGKDVEYALTDPGWHALAKIGVHLKGFGGDRRPLLRYCVDWSEQAHHLAGPVGRAVMASLLERGWLQRAKRSRAVLITARGAEKMPTAFGGNVAALIDAGDSR